jgi:hypothetical protein
MRSKLVADLDQMVAAAGGNVGDVLAILHAACMIQHAAYAIGAGMTQHQALIDIRRSLIENYPSSYVIASRAIVSASGRN